MLIFFLKNEHRWDMNRCFLVKMICNSFFSSDYGFDAQFFVDEKNFCSPKAQSEIVSKNDSFCA